MHQIYTFWAVFFIFTLATFPVSTQAQISADFDAAVIIGESTTTCNASAKGGLRYNDTKSCVEFCNSSAWVCL